MEMSEETYKRFEDVEADNAENTKENDEHQGNEDTTANTEGCSSVDLGMGEAQPCDLGTHKVIICPPHQPEDKIRDHEKNGRELMECITIVQDEYCQWDKKANKKNRVARNKIITASILCLVFIGLECLGGYWSNSLVIATDATQLLTVFSTLMASLFTVQLSMRSRDHRPLGWARVEVMGALLSILATWVMTSIVLYLAVDRLVRRDFTINVDMMLATSAFGVVANLLMGMTLHNNCYVRYPTLCDTPGSVELEGAALHTNVRAAFLHILGDFFFSVAVFTTALFIDCCPDMFIVDPISTLVLGILVLFITLSILKDILNLLVEEVPKGLFLSEVIKTLLSIEGVQQVQDLRVWVLSLDKNALSAHLIIRPGVSHNDVLNLASRKIHAKYNFFEMTVHLEELQDQLSLAKAAEDDSGSVETMQCTDKLDKQEK